MIVQNTFSSLTMLNLIRKKLHLLKNIFYVTCKWLSIIYFIQVGLWCHIIDSYVLFYMYMYYGCIFIYNLIFYTFLTLEEFLNFTLVAHTHTNTHRHTEREWWLTKIIFVSALIYIGNYLCYICACRLTDLWADLLLLFHEKLYESMIRAFYENMKF